jgi:hypothetical protein
MYDKYLFNTEYIKCINYTNICKYKLYENIKYTERNKTQIYRTLENFVIFASVVLDLVYHIHYSKRACAQARHRQFNHLILLYHIYYTIYTIYILEEVIY